MNKDNEMNRIVIIIIVQLFCMPILSYADALENCRENGWEELSVDLEGVSRKLVWKGPQGSWTKGAILVLHGGGGQHLHWCGKGKLIQPQIDFSELAIDEGFSVFSLNSTDGIMTDSQWIILWKAF